MRKLVSSLIASFLFLSMPCWASCASVLAEGRGTDDGENITTILKIYDSLGSGALDIQKTLSKDGAAAPSALIADLNQISSIRQTLYADLHSFVGTISEGPRVALQLKSFTRALEDRIEQHLLLSSNLNAEATNPIVNGELERTLKPMQGLKQDLRKLQDVLDTDIQFYEQDMLTICSGKNEEYYLILDTSIHTYPRLYTLVRTRSPLR